MRQVVLDVGPLAAAVLRLIEASSIKDKVEVRYRDAILTNAGQVMSLEDTTSYRWSTGEEYLWSFLEQLSGRPSERPVDLGTLAGYFRGQPLGRWMVACFAEAFDVTSLSGVVHQVSGTVTASSEAAQLPDDEAHLAMRKAGL